MVPVPMSQGDQMAACHIWHSSHQNMAKIWHIINVREIKLCQKIEKNMANAIFLWQSGHPAMSPTYRIGQLYSEFLGNTTILIGKYFLRSIPVGVISIQRDFH
jgi:hypothetical protein